tara:strand:- start:97 stop:567 length:471 start_codon:yes stop_codon:yes gene_type:complete
MTMTLYLLFLAVVFISVTSLGTLITLLKKPKWLYVYIPLILVVVGTTVYTYDEMMGKPTTKEVPPEFIVVSYLVDEPKDIFLWVIKNRKELTPISHVIPYSKKIHKKLEEARKGMKKRGGVIRGLRMIDLEKATNRSDTLDFQNYKFPDQELPRKE